MICPKCSSQCTDDSTFCANCGSILKNNLNESVGFNQSNIEQVNQLVNQQEPIPQPVYSQPVKTQSSTENVIDDNHSKNNKKKIILFIIFGVIILIGFGIYYFLFSKRNTENNEYNVNASSSFFICDNVEEKCGLFKNDGTQLTEFIFDRKGYDSTIYFYNGYALVEKDGNYGIIDTSGKMSVDFGEYTNMSVKGGAFYAYKDRKQYLINGNGTVLYESNDMDVNGSNTILYTYTIVKDNSSKIYIILDYKTDTIVSFSMSDNQKVKEPKVSITGNFVDIFYNNKNYVVNIKKGKQIATFESNYDYCIDEDMPDDESIIILSTCTSPKSGDNAPDLVIKNEKIYNFGDKCDEIRYHNTSLICKKDDSSYFITDNMEIGNSIYGKQFFNSNTYAFYNESNKTVDFYNNGSLVKTIKSRQIDYSSNDSGIYELYYLDDKLSRIYEFYDINGNNITNKSYKRVNNFYSDGFAIVSEDGSSYYIIDKKGNKVTNFDYKSISKYKDYYYVYKSGYEGLLDSNLKEVFDCIYLKIEIFEINNIMYAIVTTTDNKYILYNLDKNKKIAEYENLLLMII